MDVDLVVVDAERDDVARRLRVTADVEVGLQRLQGHAAFAIAGAEVGFRLADGVAAVAEGTGRTGDIPAAPAVGVRGVGLEVGEAGAAQGFALGVGHDRPGAEARRPLKALVTREALVVALEQRPVPLLLRIEQVEGRAEDRVEERHFDGTAGHPADIGFVGEVEDAGVLRADEAALLAGLAEDEELRVDGDFELFQ